MKMLTKPALKGYREGMKTFDSLTLDELDSLVKDATLTAAHESIALGLPVSGLDKNGVLRTYHPVSTKSSPEDIEAGHVKKVA